MKGFLKNKSLLSIATLIITGIMICVSACSAIVHDEDKISRERIVDEEICATEEFKNIHQQEMQKYANDLAAGKISRDEYVEQTENIEAKIVEELRRGTLDEEICRTSEKVAAIDRKIENFNEVANGAVGFLGVAGFVGSAAAGFYYAGHPEKRMIQTRKGKKKEEMEGEVVPYKSIGF